MIMKWNKRCLTFGLLLLTILLLTVPVWADESGSRVRIGGDVEVAKDERVTGDSVAMFGNHKVEGSVNGSVITIFGDLELSAPVSGNVVTIFGKTILKDTAVINGDFIAVAGKVERSPKAVISGEFTNVNLGDIGSEISRNVHVNLPISFVWPFRINTIFLSLFVTLLLIYFFPKNLQNIMERVEKDPLRIAGTGLVGVIAVIFAALLLTITIIGIPVAMLLALVIWLGFVLGNSALYLFIGEYLVRELNWKVSKYVAGIIGTVLIGLVAILPVVGGLIELIISLLGFGAVIRTRFGTNKAWIK